MFNIIKTLQNYFTHELLPYNLSSEVALHFNVSKRQPYLVVSCSEEVFLWPVLPLWLGADLVSLGGQNTGETNHKPSSELPLLSVRPVITFIATRHHRS